MIIGHACSGDLGVIHSIIKINKKMKEIQDTQKIFKGKGKLGLKEIVEDEYKKTFSKFEQCSGWNNRPLRRAQLHYAALDALVLVKIYTKSAILID